MSKTITYNDLDGAAPRITFHEREFTTGKPVEDFDDDADAVLIEAAGKNPWFDVADGEGKVPKGAGSSAYDRGYKAATDGKDRSVPVSYRGKPEGAAWLLGFDDVKKGPVPDDLTKATAGAPASPGSQSGAHPESPAPNPTAKDAPVKSTGLDPA